MNELLKFFEYSHLPTHLQDVSAMFYEVAHAMAKDLKPSDELTTALRKLLESKDCAVRAAL